MKKILVAIIMAVVISGCATKWEYKPEQEAKFNKDHKECDYKAETSVQDNGDPIGIGIKMRKIITMCMEIKGWEQAK